jgi:hypothetical protein
MPGLGVAILSVFIDKIDPVKVAIMRTFYYIFAMGIVLAFGILVFAATQCTPSNIKVIQTHKYPINEVPRGFIGAMQSWSFQPGVEYIYMNNGDCYKYLLYKFGQEHANVYNSITIGAFKADFFRYCWIYKEGGIYADLDTFCLVKLRKWLSQYKDIDIILARDDPTNFRAFYQAFIYCKEPGNLLMKECIAMVIRNVHKYKEGAYFDKFAFTGPALVYEAFCALNPLYKDRDLPATSPESINKGIIDTNNGKMMILSWSGNDTFSYSLQDNKGRSVFKHKCMTCIGDEYWADEIHERKWVAR